jgi:hypothetical protein
MRIVQLTAEAQRAQSKPIVAINELRKRALRTAIAVVSIKREATVVFYFLKPLRLCG